MNKTIIFKKTLKAMLKIHRLFGFILCLLFLIWCISGFVMMYKGFPEIPKNEKYKLKQVINPALLTLPKNINSIIKEKEIQKVTIQPYPITSGQLRRPLVFWLPIRGDKMIPC